MEKSGCAYPEWKLVGQEVERRESIRDEGQRDEDDENSTAQAQ
jgi:hypothetical protein